MTREEAIIRLNKVAQVANQNTIDAVEMAIEALEQKEKIIHCKDCKYRDYWGECNKWSKELDAHKSYILDENMFCGFAELKEKTRK